MAFVNVANAKSVSFRISKFKTHDKPTIVYVLFRTTTNEQQQHQPLPFWNLYMFFCHCMISKSHNLSHNLSYQLCAWDEPFRPEKQFGPYQMTKAYSDQ